MFDPISDTEEEREDLVYEPGSTLPPNSQSLTPSRTRTLNLKDREAIDHDKDDDDDTNPPLPDIQ